MKSDQAYKPSPQVMFRQNTDGSITIMNLDNFENYYHLDAWAAELWKQLDGKRTFGQIIDVLTERSGLERAFVEEQASKIIDDLLENKLVSLKGPQ